MAQAGDWKGIEGLWVDMCLMVVRCLSRARERDLWMPGEFPERAANLSPHFARRHLSLSPPRPFYVRRSGKTTQCKFH